MRLALIPPYAHAFITRHTDYQLVLPQCLDNAKYLRAYRMARRNGGYLILDNGAAEGLTPPSAVDIHNIAHNIMANEIVVPDTLHDAEATLKQASDFSIYATQQFNYMAVVQGKDWDECTECIRGFSNLKYVTTLGIPRHLLSLSKEMRIDLVDHIRRRYRGEYEIHLLGMLPNFTGELIGYGREYRRLGVRGVDSSTPFNYTLAGKSLNSYAQPVARAENYFELHVEDNKLMYANLCIMKDWVYSNV